MFGFPRFNGGFLKSFIERIVNDTRELGNGISKLLRFDKLDEMPTVASECICRYPDCWKTIKWFYVLGTKEAEDGKPMPIKSYSTRKFFSKENLQNLLYRFIHPVITWKKWRQEEVLNNYLRQVIFPEMRDGKLHIQGFGTCEDHVAEKCPWTASRWRSILERGEIIL